MGMRLAGYWMIALGTAVIAAGLSMGFRGTLLALLGSALVVFGGMSVQTKFRISVRRPRHRVSDLIAFVAVFAVMIAIGWPAVEREFLPKYEVSTLARIEYPRPAPVTLGTPAIPDAEIERVMRTIREYFESPEALEEIRAHFDPRSGAAPPTAYQLKRDLRERLRVTPILNTGLVSFAMDSDNPIRDAAIVDAVTSATLGQFDGMGRVVSEARPPLGRPLPSARPAYVRKAVAAAFTLVCFLACLAFAVAFRVIRFERITYVASES